MPVSSAHRFLYGESHRSAGKRIWVVHGSHLQDWYFHNQLHGCVNLRKTLELWALEGGKRITVTLLGNRTLNFSGNPDPSAAQQLFSGSLPKRPPLYKNRPGSLTATRATQQNEDTAAQDQQTRADTHQVAGGSGSALINIVTRLTQYLQNPNAPCPCLLIIEDLPYIIEQLRENQDGHTILKLKHTIKTVWHRYIAPGHLVIFLADDSNDIKEILPKQLPKVEWKKIDKPSEEEVAYALDRLAMRHGAVMVGGKAIARILADQEDTLEYALGKVIDLLNKGEREITAGKILDIPPVNELMVQDVKDELNNKMVGLEELKRKVTIIERNARQIRSSLLKGDQLPPDGSMHLVFNGPPGTGKTTAARIVAKLFSALGLLKKVEHKEVKYDDIISSNQEQSGENMTNIINAARGGVLFIDEAHQLGDEDSMGAKEIVKVIVPKAENLRRELVIILAGYADQMHTLFNKDPGLPRRFPKDGWIHFPDFTRDQLWEIFCIELKKNDYTIDPSIEQRAKGLINKRSSFPNFGNAGGIRELVKEIISLHNSGPTPDAKVISAQDLPPLIRRDQQLLDTALAELCKMLGIGPVRIFIDDMIKRIKYLLDEEEAGRGKGTINTHPGNMRFVGPPGTGKTTVAKRMGDILFGMGSVPNRTFLELTPSRLKGKHVGESESKVIDAIEKARGGVIFIDEIYSLAGGDKYDDKIVQVLVEEVLKEENLSTVFIIAGYKEKMDEFLNVNEGLPRRFVHEVTFPNFSPDDCAALAREILEEDNYRWEEGLLERIKEYADVVIRKEGEKFGNAGWVKNILLPKILGNMMNRVADFPLTDLDRRKMLIEDLPIGDDDSHANSSSVVDNQPYDEQTQKIEIFQWNPLLEYRQLSVEPMIEEPLNEQAIVSMVEAASFQIITFGVGGRNSATAFFVTPDGLMATCAHVVRGVKEISVWCGRNRDPRLAQPVAMDEELDLALLAVDNNPPVSCLPLGNSTALQPLANLIVFGNAHVQPREPGRMVTARVARNDRNNPRVFESDGAIEEGFSGGPAVDKNTGTVAGIVSGGYGVSATALIRVEQLCYLLEKLGYHFSEPNHIEEDSDDN